MRGVRSSFLQEEERKMPNNIQGNWRWCFKCQGMWFASFGTSVCPGGGGHSMTGSGNYALVYDLPGPERQSGWRYCSKCQGLWFGGNVASKCAAGGGHSQAGSFDYSVSHNAPNIPEQSSWRWCNKCQGMFWAGPVGLQAPLACKSIATEIQELEADKDELQAQLQTASTEEKPALAAAINNLTAKINAKQAQLVTCVNDHRLCPAGGSHSGNASGEYRIPQTPQNIRLHFKILTPPTSHTTTLMLAQMRQVYNAIGIGVDLVSTETLSLPTLTDLDVSQCFLGQPTAEQKELFTHRNNAAADDLVIYFVRSMTDPFWGCAAHPSGKPGAAVASTADEWTLAHEVGHVLGLLHCDTKNTPLHERLMTGQSTGALENPPPNVVGSEVSTMKASALTVSA